MQKYKYEKTIKVFFLLTTFFFILQSCSCQKQEPETKTIEKPSKTTNEQLSYKNHPSNGTKRRYLSLKGLLSKAIDDPEDKDVQMLFGLGWIEGYVIDKKNNDLIFFGREKPGWPSLTLSDLIINLMNIFEGKSPPYCSLDPIPKNILEFKKNKDKVPTNLSFDKYLSELEKIFGAQKVLVGGVPNDSHHALVMLEADYHMKKVSQGHIIIDPIESVLDASFKKSYTKSLKDLFPEKPDQSKGAKCNSSRFWFNIKPGNPKFKYAEDIVVIDKCTVVILTEAQKADADGELHDSGEEDVEAENFAETFSIYFQKAATEVEEYAKLENLFRLQALLRAMHFKGHINQVSDLLKKFLNSGLTIMTYRIPDTYPAVANARRVTYEYGKGGYIGSRIIVNQVFGGSEHGITNRR